MNASKIYPAVMNDDYDEALIADTGTISGFLDRKWNGVSSLVILPACADIYK